MKKAGAVTSCVVHVIGDKEFEYHLESPMVVQQRKIIKRGRKLVPGDSFLVVSGFVAEVISDKRLMGQRPAKKHKK